MGPTGVFGAPSSAATEAAMEVILLNSHEFEEALSLNSQTQSLTEGAPASNFFEFLRFHISQRAIITISMMKACGVRTAKKEMVNILVHS
jgi:hypothetical protein